MSNLWIHLNEPRMRFAPGETIAGEAGWELSAAPAHAELRLFWFTTGIGTRDITLIEVIELEKPRDADKHHFSFILPASPYSFSGRLVSLQWAVELVLQPGDESAIVNFEVSPFNAPITLDKLPDPKKQGIRLRARP